MADTDILPPETDLREGAPALRADAETVHLSGEIKEEGIFASLISSVRDAFFAPKLPPLVLESTPIAIVDRMAVKRDPKSTALAIVAHVAIILLIAWLIAKHIRITAPLPPKLTITELNAPPPPLPPKAEKIGGGGGQHDAAPVTQGHLPKLAQTQIVPPKAPPTIPPKLAVDPTVVVQPNLKMADNKLPNMGAPTSTLKGFSMGNGEGTGIGSGNGNGIGPGSGGNTGGGVYQVGGGVSAPTILYKPEAEFSEEARKAKFDGVVTVYVVVDEQGNPTRVQLAKGVGLGLDEKAVEAVRQYKFKAAMKDGKPVKVGVYVEVNFTIY